MTRSIKTFGRIDCIAPDPSSQRGERTDLAMIMSDIMSVMSVCAFALNASEDWNDEIRQTAVRDVRSTINLMVAYGNDVLLRAPQEVGATATQAAA